MAGMRHIQSKTSDTGECLLQAGEAEAPVHDSEAEDEGTGAQSTRSTYLKV